MKILVLMVAAMAVLMADAQIVKRRSFRGGYPAGNGVGGRVQREGALSERSAGVLGNGGSGAGKTTANTVSRKRNVRMVRAEGDFAVMAAKGDPVLVEIKEPEGCRWIAPVSNGKISAFIERGGAAKSRSKGVSGAPGTCLVSVRRLVDGDAEVTLKLIRKAAPAGAPPENTMTIRIVDPTLHS